MIKVSIVEDNAAYECLIVWALSRHKDIQIAGSYPDGEKALLGIPEKCSDVILMDIGLPGIGGIECIRLLRNLRPPIEAKVLVLTGHEQDDIVFNAVMAGSNGYLLKDATGLESLANSIREVHGGGAAITPSIANKILECFKRGNFPKNEPGALPTESVLSSREEEVLNQLARGMMYKEIASILDISIETVRKHSGSIYRKLHVRSRTDATRYYMERQHGQWRVEG